MDPTLAHTKELIRSMQSYIASPQSADLDFVRDESVAYNDLCHEVNIRLSEIADLLNRGLREDAIHAATKQGDLLALFEVLDFPQRDAWINLVDSFMLQTPPDLDYESATKLNAAHADLAELDPLLRKHRLLALARAPLGQRIAVLTRLHQKDPDNPIWPADAAVLQKARVDQFPAEIESAIEAGNSARLKSLYREINNSQWWVKIPSSNAQRIKVALEKLSKSSRYQTLKNESAALQDAYAAYDVAAATAHASQVRALAAELQVPPDDEHLQAVEPALHWVDERQHEIAQEQRATHLISALESALDSNANRDTLAQRLAAAEGLGERLPLPLLQRARDRIEGFEMVARRRTLLMIGSATLALIAIGASVGFFVVNQRQATEARNLENTFTKLIQEQRYEEADRFYQALDESLQKQASFLEGRETIRAELAKEADRVAAFASVLDQLKADESGKPQYALISRLRELAKTEEERNEVTTQEAIAENIRLQEKQKITGAHAQRMTELESSVNDFFAARDNTIDLKARQQESLKLKSELTDFIAEVKASSPDIAATAEQLQKLLDSELDRMQRAESRQNDLSEITASIPDLPRFIAAAERFAETYPDDPMSARLSAASEWTDNVAAAMAWIRCERTLNGRSPLSVTTKQAEEWLTQYKLAQSLAPKHPFAIHSQKLKTHLDKVSQRAAAIENLKKMFSSRLLSKMWVYRDAKTGDKYFSNMSPERDDDKQHKVSYFTDPSMLRREHNFGFEDYREKVKPNVALASHSEFAESILPLTAQLNPDNFTPICYQIIERFRRMDVNQTDPIFKAYLFKRFLETVLPASEPLTAGYQRVLDQLNQNQKDDRLLNWLLPGASDPQVQQARRNASATLAKITDWDNYAKAMGQRYNELKRGGRPGEATRWVGWIGKQNDQAVVFFSESPPSKRLFVIDHETSSTGTSQPLTLANPTDSPSEIDSMAVISQPEEVPIGSPVYYIPPL